MFAGFMLEAQMGSCRMMGFYLCVGICANLFASTINDWYAAGPEPAMFGMIAGLIGMYVYYWEKMGNDWCRKVCGLFLMIFLLVIGIFFLTAMAEPYKNYTKAFRISYPDGAGLMGGCFFGFPMSWIFLVPTTGSIFKNAPRRDRGLFIAGLLISMTILLIIIVVFSFDNEPKEYWYYE